MEASIVFEGTSKTGKPYCIRYVQPSDAPAMLEYINLLSRERTFVRMQGEQLTLEDEEKYVNSQIVGIENKKAILILAVVGESVVGICGLNMKDKTERHVASLHISVAKEYRGEGIGSQLIESILKEAEENLSGLQIVILSVYAANTTAIELYKKFGFIEFGKLPNGLVRNNIYEDEIYMFKNLSNKI